MLRVRRLVGIRVPDKSARNPIFRLSQIHYQFSLSIAAGIAVKATPTDLLAFEEIGVAGFIDLLSFAERIGPATTIFDTCIGMGYFFAVRLKLSVKEGVS